MQVKIIDFKKEHLENRRMLLIEKVVELMTKDGPVEIQDIRLEDERIVIDYKQKESETNG